MFSQTAEYALRAIVSLADADESQTNRAIAKRTRVPGGYLSKVLQSLVRAGLVVSRRGPDGGFVIARRPEELSVLQVINAVDPIGRIETCPLGLEGHGTHLCPLHRKLDDAIAEIERTLGACTIADLLATPTQSHPLCDGIQVERPTVEGGHSPYRSQ